MTFDELLQQRRSVRKFKDMPVETDVVREMIRECTLAPSAMHAQPWKFIIVHNLEMIQRVSEESRANILNRILANPDGYGRLWGAKHCVLS